MAINRVVEIGNLTRDMELKYAPGGMAFGNFSIAVNRRVKKDQEWVDEVNYFDVLVLGKQAEALKPYLLKGKKVGIDGYLKQDRWQDQNGQNRSAIKIVANDIELLGGNQNNNSNSGYNNDEYGYGN